MHSLFSTTGVHPRDRFDLWHSVARENIVDHDSEPECRQTFHAQLDAGELSGIGFVLFENSPMTISHTAHQAARANPDVLFICRQDSGHVALEQDNREAVLGSGDVALLDPRLPYRARTFAGSRMLVLRVPRGLLEARVGKTRAMIARPIRPHEAEGGLVSGLLAMLPACCGQLSSAGAGIVKNQLLDLVALSLAGTMEGRELRVSSARSLALLRVRAAVETCLTDPALDAATAAAAAGVSVRYANSVLADDGTSITRLILARRLERCRRALEDPSQAHRTISDIAYGWGFSDMTHFGRRFRAAYGALPRDYRGLAKAGA